MRCGYVTGFATPIKDRVDKDLLNGIKNTGFGFAEFPLVLLKSLLEMVFVNLQAELDTLGLDADASCNMFPASIRLTDTGRDVEAARLYLQSSFARLNRLGTKKIIFGSSGARNLPKGTDYESGFLQIIDLVVEVILPLLIQHDLTLCMEPIGRFEANFINSLEDGMRVVHVLHHPRVRLLTKEPVTPKLEAILLTIKKIGYDKTLSFEPMPHSREEMAQALQIVKPYLD